MGRGLSPRPDGGNLGSPTQVWNNLFVKKVQAESIQADRVSGTIFKPDTAYSLGDIVSMEDMPWWARIECVIAGTTGSTAPSLPDPLTAGTYITSGTATFIVDDIREGNPVGRVFFDSILRPGCIRANGAEYASASTNYPRLLAWLNANPSLLAADAAAYAANNGLWLYDSGTDTLTAPNYVDRVVQGAAAVGMLEAGLPNIEGTIEDVYFIVPTLAPSTGALSSTMGVAHNNADNPANTTTDQTIVLDASKSNSIYGGSTTVQPPAITAIPQCKY